MSLWDLSIGALAGSKFGRLSPVVRAFHAGSWYYDNPYCRLKVSYTCGVK